MRESVIILGILLIFNFSFGQRKVYHAVKLDQSPKIDGLEDSVWHRVPSASGFFQYSPDNGEAPSYKTVVKLAYSNRAIYVFAYLFQPHDKIYDYLTQRDQTGASDWFGVFFDTYNTGQVAYAFIVTAAGVQVDKKVIGTTDDYQWDAVWKSAVKKTPYGWTVEMRIPFNHLRFSKKQVQNWGINFMRNIQENRELDSWNYMDIKQNDMISQFGSLAGISDIKPGMRIDLYPYASYYIEKQTDKADFGKYYNGGMDLKLGLSHSFTLDMMLVPDFGDVMTDEPVLNLSPYETYYMEKRQFFTEGTEIFNTGKIFYSKRIGGQPTRYYDVYSQLGPNEIVENNPVEVQILNATKISGKTRNKLGIGFLNAVTSDAYAEILDTLTGRERYYRTDYQTNYSVLALRKDLANSSYVGFVNTNKYVLSGKFYVANVSAIESSLYDKSRTFKFFLRSAASLKMSDFSFPQFGYMYSTSLAKVKGNFKFSFLRSLYTDTYDPNDLGYLKQNNIVTNSASVGYYIYKPVLFLRKWITKFSVTEQSLYQPMSYIGTQIQFESYGTLKNLMSVGLRLNFTPDKVYNYFEPRVEDYVYIEYPKQNYTFWISTDYSKKLALDLQSGVYFPIENKVMQTGGWILFSPRIRFGDHALLVYSVKGNVDKNDYGYVGASTSQDSVFFGKRDIRTLENVVNLNLNFTAKSYLTFRVRHYWSLVNYSDYYALLRDGSLVTLNFPYHYIENQDKNFNSFNVDFVYTWQFIPGSELSVVYKKQLTALSSDIITNYRQNFEMFYYNTPGLETILVKVVIYI